MRNRWEYKESLWCAFSLACPASAEDVWVEENPVGSGRECVRWIGVPVSS
jgi:hypothetical protein